MHRNFWLGAAGAIVLGSGSVWAAEGEAGTANKALPSSALRFVAIAPCRLADTRGNGFSGAFGPPSLVASSTRDFPVAGQCGVSATAQAVSLNVTVVSPDRAGFIGIWPGGDPQPNPLVSSLNYVAGQVVPNAVVAPLGSTGAMTVLTVGKTDLLLDVNGYYEAAVPVESVNGLSGNVTVAAGANVTVTPSGNTLTIAATGSGGTPVQSLNGLNGNLTIAAGANVTVTPSGTTLTVAATGGPGGALPAGAANQTLRSNGSAWLASGVLTNDGANVGISGNLLLPVTGAGGAAGVVLLGGDRFLHNYGPAADAGNTFVGQQTGNFFVGGANSWEGKSNTAIGYQSLFSDTTGYQNTASGFQSLRTNTTGASNTASGDASLYANTSGNSNTASGYASLFSNSTGSNNTASGNQSLMLNVSGSYNTASGSSSLERTTGLYNTAIGYFAGYGNTVGLHNTFLGTYTDGGANNLTNATAIGSSAIVDASNHVRIGNGSVTQIGGQVGWTNLSDARHKENIRDLELGLDFVLALRPVAYSLKQGDARTDMGFLAQDVEALLGDGYSVLGIGGDAERTLSLRYTDLIAPMVKALQEQDAAARSQQSEIATRDARIAQLEARSNAQQAQIEGLLRRVQALVEARNPAKAAGTTGAQ